MRFRIILILALVSSTIFCSKKNSTNPQPALVEDFLAKDNEISGWNRWPRQSGNITRPKLPSPPKYQGTGLKATHQVESHVLLEIVESPVYFEKSGKEPHADIVSPPYKIEWTGSLVPELTDRYRF